LPIKGGKTARLNYGSETGTLKIEERVETFVCVTGGGTKNALVNLGKEAPTPKARKRRTDVLPLGKGTSTVLKNLAESKTPGGMG